MLLVAAHEIAPLKFQYVERNPLINPRRPVCRPPILLGVVRLMRARLGSLLGYPPINRIARMREIILGQLLPNFVGLFVGALALPLLFE